MVFLSKDNELYNISPQNLNKIYEKDEMLKIYFNDFSMDVDKDLKSEDILDLLVRLDEKYFIIKHNEFEEHLAKLKN